MVWVATTDKKVAAYDVATGDKIWSRRLRAPLTASPVFRRGSVFCKTAFPDNKVYALRATDGRRLWRRDGADTMSNLVAGDEFVAFGSDTGVVFINLQDGIETGRVDCGERPQELIWAAPDAVIALTPRGNWFLCESGKKAPVWGFGAGAGATTPVVKDDTVWGANGAGELIGVDLRGGTEVARAALGDVAVGVTATVGGGLIVCGRRSLSSLTAAGEIVWRGELTKNLVGVTAALDGVLVVLEDGGLGFTDGGGTFMSLAAMKGAGVTAPAVDGGKVLVGDGAGNLYCYGVQYGSGGPAE